MLTFRHVLPLFGIGALLAAACNDDKALAEWCVIKHHEALPQEIPGYHQAIAVDGEGRVHVAAPSLHIVREPGGSWSREEEAFGASYFGEVALAASGPGVVVAHTADGLRVARGASGAWTTIFDRSYEQCSGHPYVERVEAAEDGAVLLASSEGEAVSVSPYTGEVLGKARLEGPVSLPPIVADGTVYFLTDDGDLVAYR